MISLGPAESSFFSGELYVPQLWVYFGFFYLSVTWFILRGETKIDFKPVVREGRESEGERLVQQCWELNPTHSGTLRR